MTADDLAELEEERDFLLTSLDDLDREYAAGDVDDEDYHTLGDGYTVRLASTIRAIDEGRSQPADTRSRNWGRRISVAAGSIALIAVVWWALSASSAQRLAGQTITGADPRSEIEVLRAQARSLQFEQPASAAEIYQRILDEDPDDANALTYGGWTRALAAIRDPDATTDVAAELLASSEMLGRAIEVDPGYPDPYCLRGVVLARFLERPEAGRPDLMVCLDGNPPADIADLVGGLLADIDAQATSTDGAVRPVTTAP